MKWIKKLVKNKNKVTTQMELHPNKATKRIICSKNNYKLKNIGKTHKQKHKASSSMGNPPIAQEGDIPLCPFSQGSQQQGNSFGFSTPEAQRWLADLKGQWCIPTKKHGKHRLKRFSSLKLQEKNIFFDGFEVANPSRKDSFLTKDWLVFSWCFYALPRKPVAAMDMAPASRIYIELQQEKHLTAGMLICFCSIISFK